MSGLLLGEIELTRKVMKHYGRNIPQNEGSRVDLVEPGDVRSQ